MSLLGVYAYAATAVLGLMVVLWLVSLARRNSSIVDIFWGAGFVLANWIAFALSPQAHPVRQWLLNILVTLWGLRLSLYILWRNWGKEEDFRYRKWREEAGGRWWWQSLFKVFLLQGILLVIIAAPLVVAQAAGGPARLTALDVLAVALWLFGFAFEAGGDLQLARFKADPANRGRLLTTGFWRYTRHPNYFGDAAQWWAFYLVAAATGLGAVTLFSPLLMTILLVRVSGVGLLEKTLKETKPGFEEYMQTTSAFIPWFPRRRSSGD